MFRSSRHSRQTSGTEGRRINLWASSSTCHRCTIALERFDCFECPPRRWYVCSQYTDVAQLGWGTLNRVLLNQTSPTHNRAKSRLLDDHIHTVTANKVTRTATEGCYSDIVMHDLWIPLSHSGTQVFGAYSARMGFTCYH